MKRTLFLVAALVAFATAAGAATLTVVSDKLTYLPGETITLTVTGDDQGANDTFAQGALQFNGSLVDNNTRSQTQLVGQYGKWSLGVLFNGDTNANSATSAYTFAFNQLAGTYAQTATNLPAANPLATVTLIAQALGVVNVGWDTTPGGPNELHFFGLTGANAPAGTAFEIVPEPTTVALLGLGLVGLVLGGRRRS